MANYLNYANVVDGKAVYLGCLPEKIKDYSEERLQENSWYIWEEVHVEYDQETHYLGSPRKEIVTDKETGHKKMVYTDTPIAFTPAEKKQRDYDQWKGQMAATDERWLSQGTMVPMPRVIEEILTKIGLDGIREEIVEQYNEKRALRAKQPPKPEGTE